MEHYLLKPAKRTSRMITQEYTLDASRSQMKYDITSLIHTLNMAIQDNIIDPDYCHLTSEDTSDDFQLVHNTEILKKQLLRSTKQISGHEDEYELLFVFKKTSEDGVFIKGAIRHQDTIMLLSSGTKSLYIKEGVNFINTHDEKYGSTHGKMTAPLCFWTYLYITL